MALQHPGQTYGAERVGARSPPGALQTQNLDRNARFSYLETPSQVSRPVFEQSSSPTNSTINESPISPGVHHPLYDAHAYTTPTEPSYPIEKDIPGRTTSPYNFPPPQEVHPAHFAPYADEHAVSPVHPRSPSYQMSTLSPRPQSSAPDEHKTRMDSKDQATIPINGPDMDKVKASPRLEKKTRTPTYNPDCFAGPNIIAESHRPGQVSHPNSAIQPEWKHGLCEMDTTCCVGLFCPCMVYGKTQYRLSQKAGKREATDLLGYETCNGSCVLMAVACGFQWLLATIQRTRIRKAYQLHGSVRSDCLKSFCCCCCVLMQDEREVRTREELLRRYAGPASGAYISPEPMSYKPPPG